MNYEGDCRTAPATTGLLKKIINCVDTAEARAGRGPKERRRGTPSI